MSTPHVSLIPSSSVLCDRCHEVSSDTVLVSFTRIHSFGRKKHLCKSCRQQIVLFLKQTRIRHKKSANVLQLANQCRVVCPCGKCRKLTCSILYKYTCDCCYPFSACTLCSRYIKLPLSTTPASKRTWDSLMDNYTKHTTLELKTQLMNEVALLIYPSSDLYDPIRHDVTLAMYSKDVSIHCLCTLCGRLHCPSRLVFSTTFTNFICPKCLFLYTLEDPTAASPSVEKFIICVVESVHIATVLSCLTKYAPVHGGDVVDTTMTQFTLGDQGKLLMVKGIDLSIISMPFLK